MRSRLEAFPGFGLIGVLLIIGALTITVGGVLVWRGTPLLIGPTQPTLPPIQEPEEKESDVTIETDKTKYQNNGLVFEPVGFTITNNSGKTIYHLKGCAVQFPGACKVVGSDCQPLLGPAIVCMAEPTVAELAHGETLRSYWDQRQRGNEFVPSGGYRLVFSYSFEKTQFNLIKPTLIHSQPFTIQQLPQTRETTEAICQSWKEKVKANDLTYPYNWCEIKLREKFGG